MNGATLFITFFIIIIFFFAIGAHDYQALLKIENSRQELLREVIEPTIAEGKELDRVEIERILAEIKNNQPILPFLGVSDDALNRFVCERIELTAEEVRAKGDRITADDLGEIGNLFECKI